MKQEAPHLLQVGGGSLKFIEDEYGINNVDKVQYIPAEGLKVLDMNSIKKEYAEYIP